MKAEVTHTEEAEPISITVRFDAYNGGKAVEANLNGSSAVITSLYPPEGEEDILGEEVTRAIKLMESLACVNAVRFAEPEEE